MEPDVIKIDIEGAEVSAVRGLLPYLQQHKPAIIVEITDARESLFQMMTSCGYHLYDITGGAVDYPHSLNFNTLCLHPSLYECPAGGLDQIRRCVDWGRGATN